MVSQYSLYNFVAKTHMSPHAAATRAVPIYIAQERIVKSPNWLKRLKCSLVTKLSLKIVFNYCLPQMK